MNSTDFIQGNHGRYWRHGAGPLASIDQEEENFPRLPSLTTVRKKFEDVLDWMAPLTEEFFFSQPALKSSHSPSSPSFPSISENEFAEFLKNAIENKPIGKVLDLGDLLEKAGYSRNISNINFSDKNGLSLQGIQLNDVTFTNCIFDWSHLSGMEISKCVFRSNIFRNTSFMNSKLNNCTFEGSVFKQAMFVNAELNNVTFNDSVLHNSSFEDAYIKYSSFIKSHLPETYFPDAIVSNVKITESNLENTVFFDNRHHFTIDEKSQKSAKVDKPLTATIVFPEKRGTTIPLVCAKIAGVAELIPIRLAAQSPKVKLKEIDAEVSSFLDQVKEKKEDKEDQSIPQQLLHAIRISPDQFPNASKTIDKVRRLAPYFDSIVLPGGEDISPRLYGEEKAPKSKWEGGDYRRSILEIGLIDAAIYLGIPSIFICRSSQMYIAYRGAKLHQHIGDQIGVRAFETEASSNPEKAAGRFLGDILDNLTAAVFHHQAVGIENQDKLNKHVDIALTHMVTDPETGKQWKIIMAVEPKTGAPIIALQFHPEFHDAQHTVDALLFNEELIEKGNKLKLKTPEDIIESGILVHTSSGNDRFWQIVRDAALVRRYKRSLTKILARSQT